MSTNTIKFTRKWKKKNNLYIWIQTVWWDIGIVMMYEKSLFPRDSCWSMWEWGVITPATYLRKIRPQKYTVDAGSELHVGTWRNGLKHTHTHMQGERKRVIEMKSYNSMNTREGTFYLHSFSPTTDHNYTWNPGELLRAGWPPSQQVEEQGIRGRQISPWEGRVLLLV